jgi:thiamine-phosphate pyrophosphorylase
MTNLIVISSETDIENEISLVNGLFDAGLRLFHLRKPWWTIEKQGKFLSGIHKTYLERISVHQHYQTIEEFKLGYCHVKEKDRKDLVKQTHLIYSTSFHDYNDLQFESHTWNYCFLSPVFDSISKTNYQSAFAKDFHIEEDLYQRVFALGGVTKENINSVFERGFYGAAVLGSIWSQPEEAITNFKELDAICQQHAHTL